MEIKLFKFSKINAILLCVVGMVMIPTSIYNLCGDVESFSGWSNLIFGAGLIVSSIVQYRYVKKYFFVIKENKVIYYFPEMKVPEEVDLSDILAFEQDWRQVLIRKSNGSFSIPTTSLTLKDRNKIADLLETIIQQKQVA